MSVVESDSREIFSPDRLQNKAVNLWTQRPYNGISLTSGMHYCSRCSLFFLSSSSSFLTTPQTLHFHRPSEHRSTYDTKSGLPSCQAVSPTWTARALSVIILIIIRHCIIEENVSLCVSSRPAVVVTSVSVFLPL